MACDTCKTRYYDAECTELDPDVYPDLDIVDWLVPKASKLLSNSAIATVCLIVTQSGKTGLIAYLKVLRNAGFKYLVCCSLPMVEAMCTKFSHVLHQFLTFQSIHCASSKQLSFLPF